MDEGARGSQALDRFVALLSALGEADETLGTAELAERAGLPTSSTYRLVQALERQGFVERLRRGQLSLGLRVLEFASQVEERVEGTIVTPAMPVMARLAAEHKETVLLTAPVAASAIGLASVDSPRPVRLTYARWRLAPLHRGASGKILLANLPEARRDEVLATVARREPALDPDALRRELDEARERGHVVTHAELDEGASGVAAPILDGRGRLVAGLTIAGPSARIQADERALAAAVSEGAAAIGHDLAG